MINIAELLKDFPKGWKLYSPLFGEVNFVGVDKQSAYPINVTDCKGNGKSFTEFGVYFAEHPDSECLLFPSKDCRTWEGWKLPVKPKFKAGDWLVYNNGNCFAGGFSEVQVVKVKDGVYYFASGTTGSFKFIDDRCRLWTIQDAKNGDVLCTYEGGNPKIVFILRGNLEGNCSVLSYYCYYNIMYPHFEPNAERGCLAPKRENVKPATKEQRDLLFAKMKEAGYEWDDEKKELKKIINSNFKVGDEIKAGNTIDTVAEVDYATRSYCCKSGRTIWFENQDLWHLAPKPHYDISNFHAGMPVLVRDNNVEDWRYTEFSHISSKYRDYNFVAGCIFWHQCIPFEGNEHLLGTTDMCDEQYINW